MMIKHIWMIFALQFYISTAVYTQELTVEEKIYGLSKIWSEVKANYVSFETLPIDWDSLYMEYLSKIQAELSTVEYYTVLTKFLASLRDAHSSVSWPRDLRSEYQRNAPIRAELLEGKVYVTDVYNSFLVESGLKKGHEILEIDGKGIWKYADEIKPLMSSSTEQDLYVRVFSYDLFGQPIFFSLPGGGRFWVCTEYNFFPNVEFVGIGVLPDVVVEPTVNDLINGGDSALKRALELLE